MKQELNANDKLESLKKLYGDKSIEQASKPLLNNQNAHDMAKLIDYYRLVLDTYEKEKKTYSNLFENLKVKNENLHKIEWETKKREEEIIELKRALEESNFALNNERKKAIHFSQMLQNCEEIAKDDKRRIGQILQLTEPIEQTIKLYKDRSPEITEKYSNYNFQEGLNEKNFVPNNKKKTKNKSKKKHVKPIINPYDKNKEHLHNLIIKSSDTQQQILRTVLFPEEKKQIEKNDENEQLKNQIEDAKKNYEDQIEKLEEIRKIREEDFRQNLLNFRQQSNELLNENQKLENLNYLTCKDLMELKYDNGIKERKNYEKMDEIKTSNKKIANDLKSIVQNYTKEKKFNQNEYNKKTREMTKCLRDQVRAQEEAANLIKEQYKQIQKIYGDRVNDLNQKTNNLIEKINFLQNNKNFLIEGYINEIELMRKRLIGYRNFAVKLGLVAKHNFNKGMNIYMNQFHQKFYDDDKYEKFNHDNDIMNKDINIENNDNNYHFEENYDNNQEDNNYHNENDDDGNNEDNINDDNQQPPNQITNNEEEEQEEIE